MPSDPVAGPTLGYRRDGCRPSAQDGATTVIRAGRATARAVLTDARGGDQVERARTETVCGAGQCADRADLDRVAGEVGLERLLLVDADLLQGTTLDKGDERVAGDLVGKAGAACTQNTAFTIEQHLRGDADRLGVGALDV